MARRRLFDAASFARGELSVEDRVTALVTSACDREAARDEDERECRCGPEARVGPRSIGARPPHGASAAASPAASRTRSSGAEAAPGSAPPATADHAARTAPDQPAGEESTTPAAARESPAPSPGHAWRGARSTPATSLRRRRALTQTKATSKRTGPLTLPPRHLPLRPPPAGFLHPTACACRRRRHLPLRRGKSNASTDCPPKLTGCGRVPLVGRTDRTVMGLV